MTWLILLFFAAFGVAYLLRRRRGKAELEAALEYRFSFEADEVFRGEYLTLCQTVINRSARPIPFLKLETLMPEGLELVYWDYYTMDHEPKRCALPRASGRFARRNRSSAAGGCWQKSAAFMRRNRWSFTLSPMTRSAQTSFHSS